MSAHTHTTLTPGCYRCELNIDEMRTVKRRDYTKTTRLWGRCEGCRYTWQWNGRTEYVAAGLHMIWESVCGCMRSAS